MKEEILKLADRHLEEAIALRHELHKIPEIAGKEFKTSALLRKRLEALPLKVLDPFLETDVVALLNDSRSRMQCNSSAPISTRFPLRRKIHRIMSRRIRG